MAHCPRWPGTRIAGIVFFCVNLGILGWVFGNMAWSAWVTGTSTYTRLFPADVFGELVFKFFWPTILTLLVYPLRSRIGWPVAIDLIQPLGTVLIGFAYFRLALIVGAI